ncbi:hypothetical protein PI125_g26873 [Phytophthora idaei]|nr:hypothetical protein PI125_g26873 [Phytophthora idaei]
MLIENPVEELSDDGEGEEIRPGAIPRGLTRMVDEMYANINNPEIATDEYFANRAILTTTNAVVSALTRLWCNGRKRYLKKTCRLTLWKKTKRSIASSRRCCTLSTSMVFHHTS